MQESIFQQQICCMHHTCALWEGPWRSSINLLKPFSFFFFLIHFIFVVHFYPWTFLDREKSVMIFFFINFLFAFFIRFLFVLFFLSRFRVLWYKKMTENLHLYSWVYRSFIILIYLEVKWNLRWQVLVALEFGAFCRRCRHITVWPHSTLTWRTTRCWGWWRCWSLAIWISTVGAFGIRKTHNYFHSSRK